MSLICNPEAQGSHPTFAFLSNTKSNTGDITIINLDTIQMSYSLFEYLFYNTSTKNFYINDSNSDYCALNFNNFTINGKPFSLVDLFLSTWESNTQTNRNTLNPYERIITIKYLSKYKNIVNILPYVVSLSIEDLVNTLIDNMVIQESNKLDSTAKITVILSANIFLPNLSLPITFNLPISTNLTGYENLFHNNSLGYIPQIPNTMEDPISSSNEISADYSLEELSSSYNLEERNSNNENIQGLKLNSLVNLSGEISGEDSVEDSLDANQTW